MNSVMEPTDRTSQLLRHLLLPGRDQRHQPPQIAQLHPHLTHPPHISRQPRTHPLQEEPRQLDSNLAGGFGQLLPCVVADGLQHPVAHFTGLIVNGGEQRLVDQAGKQVQDPPVTQLAADPPGGLKGEGIGEHRAPVEHVPFRRGQQVVAPVDGSPQGLTAR